VGFSPPRAKFGGRMDISVIPAKAGIHLLSEKKTGFRPSPE
jgi:hypothetical protein